MTASTTPPVALACQTAHASARTDGSEPSTQPIDRYGRPTGGTAPMHLEPQASDLGARPGDELLGNAGEARRDQVGRVSGR